MKYIITGSLGNISKPLAQKLIAAGHEVIVISSKEDKKSAIEALGAKAAIGSVQDVAFLTKTFSGADAVYTMVPPNYAAADWKGYIEGIGKKYAEAIKASGVKNVVNLSSVGAHMANGCGPVSGLYHEEQALNGVAGINVKHLRPGYFYQNFLNNVALIKNKGIMGGNYGEGTSLIIVYPKDIADVAAEELLNLSFKGSSVRYVASDERTTHEVAKVLGAAIGKPELPWVNFKDEDSLGGMLGAGLPEEIAKNFVEMGAALRAGTMSADYYKNKPASLGKTKLEEFAKEFAAVYNS